MCGPEVIETVHRRIGRRALFGSLGAAALTVATAGAVRAEPVIGSAIPAGRLVDLTHTLSPTFPVWPGSEPFTMRPVAAYELGGFLVNELSYWEHTGTHIDAPAHRIRGGATADILPLEDLIAPLVVVDISARAASDPEAVVTIGDIAQWEREHGRIPDRALVVMHSGWQNRLAERAAPGFGADAAQLLVRERGIVGIGVDTLSLDRMNDREYPAHTAVLGAGRYGVEALANLDAVPPAGATVVVGAPKHAGATGGPCRVFAVTPG
ncbi:cyclase [Rhodococcus sp. 05-2255-3B1]|uniref:cyclase family protein n=1 Tax=unclassified Rhodococcus (in: high G+C Gram-positive bacteria) TaxID=192944 RepID=UPI000B9B8FB2|nr:MULTISPECIES: cyclase family protein [unclassified Rhodococcus (in: high G+C Gram-positive bacteria)]OZE08119.1 cyclase [Rhodococcus sp. 05-2255-3B1]OZE15158.1 cyclase [Rhodococcus sp. 05-2255-3C]OZE22951.1 cyclase [Rhodococcus sp. 05-2255-2A2]